MHRPSSSMAGGRIRGHHRVMTSTAHRTDARPRTAALGAVHLTVRDLGRSVDFYERSLGLVTRDRDPRTARLGAGGDDLVVLHADPRAPDARRHAGLFHMALLFPDRAALAGAVLRLIETRTPVQGASDHGVSEALYLPDAEGNGIELYADRPRAEWPPPEHPGDRVGMVTAPLDIEDLLGAAPAGAGAAAAPPGLVMGHVHLHVGDLDAAVAFHRDVTGMDVMQHYPGAVFLSVGGYHHHLAVNVWRGAGVPPAPEGALGLRHWTLRIPDEADRAALLGRAGAAGGGGGALLRDPAGNAVLVAP